MKKQTQNINSETMLFDQYNPIENKLFQVIDNEGALLNPATPPALDNEKIIKAYKSILFARTVDIMAVSYQRQGRMFIYLPNYSQEAISAAAGFVMWLMPAFREMGAWIAKGASMKDIFLYFMGYEEGNALRSTANMLPVSVPIASQLLQAVGSGYFINYKEIAEAQAFMQIEGAIYDVAQIIHVHPTISEIFMEAGFNAMDDALKG